MSRNPQTILGLDTTTTIATAGVIRGGQRLASRSESRPDGHAAAVAGVVEATLADAGLSPADLDALAVAVGPGSFTGIRIGIGFAKGMAFARGIGLVGVGTLDALAEAAPDDDLPVAACLDARKREVYLGFYGPRGEDGRPALEPVRALPPEAAAAIIAERFADGRGIVVGDAVEVYRSDFAPLERRGIRWSSFAEVHPRGDLVAEIGGRRLAAGLSQRSEEVVATYVRPSAAEAKRQAQVTR